MVWSPFKSSWHGKRIKPWRAFGCNQTLLGFPIKNVIQNFGVDRLGLFEVETQVDREFQMKDFERSNDDGGGGQRNNKCYIRLISNLPSPVCLLSKLNVFPASDSRWQVHILLKHVEPCLRPSYLLLWLQDFMLEACLLLAGARVHRLWWPQYKPLGWEWGLKKLQFKLMLKFQFYSEFSFSTAAVLTFNFVTF